jgi:lysophospholipase L1-like esterase
VIGIPEWLAYRLMPVVGMFDIALGLLVVLRPARAALLWAGWPTHESGGDMRERTRALLRRLLPTSLLVLAVSASMAASPTGVGEANETPRQGWVGAWSAAPLRPDLVGTSAGATLSRTGLEDQTVRQVVYLHLGGSHVRVRLANTFGTQPITFAEVRVALQDAGATNVPGSDRRLTFGGQGAVTIPVGAEAYSDPAALTVRPLQSLAVSLYASAPSGPATWHPLGAQTLYLAIGNRTADIDGAAFGAPSGLAGRYWLTGVDVAVSAPAAAIVALGDSLTDGFASTPNANNRWPDHLARRLHERSGSRLSVLNAGVAGNRVLSDTATQQNVLARLPRDVLVQDGVRYVILLAGINDIGTACMGTAQTVAEQVIAADRQIIAQARIKRLTVFGGTLMPFKGTTLFPGYYCEAGETDRQALNTWIRTSGEFDGVIDFDRALRDPIDAQRLSPAYDSGDHLHPNDVGYKAMADAIDLGLFCRPSLGVSGDVGRLAPACPRRDRHGRID